MKPTMYINEWQCSINILNATVYRKFQHASLHNPIKNTAFTLPKKNSTFREKNDHNLFKNSTQYKLPTVRTYRKKLRQQKQNHTKETQTSSSAKKPFFRHLQTPNKANHGDQYHHMQFKEKLRRFRENIQNVFSFGERDKYFSYFCNVVNQICVSIEDTQNKEQKVNILIVDLELLLKNIDKNRSVLNTLKKMTIFKHNSQYLQFKMPQSKVLYHIILAQLQFYGKDYENCIKQFEFCQYYSRKEGLENLTLGFLWQMAHLNLCQSKYQDADENLRNLLEMAVICRQKKAIKYALQKISLIYYYRGNSIMGQFYLKKSDTGLTPFQIQMYFKQYNCNDEIKRLEQKLFYLPAQEAQEERVKRKNNPKLQGDVWKQSKEDYQKNMEQYMESINQMLKDHEHAKLGRQIKKIVRKVNFLGSFTKNSQASNISNFTLPLKQLESRKTFASQNNGFKEGRPTLRKSLNELNQNKSKKQIKISGQNVQDNITNVIKTHLSMNRQNSKISREQRWRKCMSFIFTLESQLREMAGVKQKPVSKTEPRLKTVVNQNTSQ